MNSISVMIFIKRERLQISVFVQECNPNDSFYKRFLVINIQMILSKKYFHSLKIESTVAKNQLY